MEVLDSSACFASGNCFNKTLKLSARFRLPVAFANSIPKLNDRALCLDTLVYISKYFCDSTTSLAWCFKMANSNSELGRDASYRSERSKYSPAFAVSLFYRTQSPAFSNASAVLG